MQRRIRIGHRPYWITTLQEDGAWYGIGTFDGETITAQARNETDAIALWREAAEMARSVAESSESE